jgi:hypothetical protein
MSDASANEKHAATLALINHAPYYSMVRLFCAACLADLRDKSASDTFDCRLGALSGCGARYCSLQCLVSHGQHDCTAMQSYLCRLAGACFIPGAAERLENFPTARTRIAIRPTCQWQLLAADLLPDVDATAMLCTMAEAFEAIDAPVLAKLVTERSHHQYAVRRSRCSQVSSPLPTFNYNEWFEACEAALAFFRITANEHFSDRVAHLYYLRGGTHIILGNVQQGTEDVLYARQLYRELYGEESKSVAFCFKALAMIYSRQSNRRYEAQQMNEAAAYLFAHFNIQPPTERI